MSFRNFLLGIFASFSLAWGMVVVYPFFKMRALEPIVLTEATDGKDGIYFPKRSGRVANGAAVYAANGCYLCHTQVIRPTYAGNDLYRDDWAGLKDNGEGLDTRRETNAFDFEGEKFAQIGVSRLGPDLSNLGRRVEAIYAKGSSAEAWLYKHLYNPRGPVERRKSDCPDFRFLFEEREIKGNPSSDALPFSVAEGKEIVPNSDAKALVSYLLSLKKDDAVPSVLNFAPPKKKADG
jgi:cytochrome c oxidase cbb3-type subunit 2